MLFSENMRPWRQANIRMPNHPPHHPTPEPTSLFPSSPTTPHPHHPSFHVNESFITPRIMTLNSEYFQETRVHRWAINRYLDFCLAEATRDGAVYGHDGAVTRWLTALTEYTQLKIQTSASVRANTLLSAYYTKVRCQFSFIEYIIGPTTARRKSHNRLYPCLAHWTTDSLLGCPFSALVGLVIGYIFFWQSSLVP